MDDETTRRQFLKGVATPVILTSDSGWLDEDGDGSFLDDVLPWGNDGAEGAKSPVAVGTEAERKEIDSRTAKMYLALSGTRYKPADNGDWVKIDDSAPVSDVFGRKGSVSAQDGDYAASQIADFELSALLEGADADKPSAGSDGRYYYATDSRILYRDNGTSWVAQSGRGTSSTPLPDQHVQTLIGDEVGITDQSDRPSESELSSGLFIANGRLYYRRA